MSLAANNDDSEANLGTGLIQTDVTTGLREHGFRFTGAGELVGATIQSAILRVQFADLSGGALGVHVNIGCEAADDASQFTDGSAYSNFTARPRTTQIDWDLTGSYLLDQIINSPDITTAVQEVVDRPGFTGTIHVLVDRINGDMLSHWHREGSVAKSARLLVCYDEPPAEITIEGNVFASNREGANLDGNRLIRFEMGNPDAVVFDFKESEVS